MKTAYELSQRPVFDIAAKQSGILRVEFEREIQAIITEARNEAWNEAVSTAAECCFNCAEGNLPLRETLKRICNLKKP